MEEVSIIGLDIAKNTFQAHGATADGGVVFRKKLARGKVLEFLSKQPACVVALEACASAHHWAREIAALGHDVRLIPPIYVKPFVKRQKNDAADAEAIAEAATRATMRTVAVKDLSLIHIYNLLQSAGQFLADQTDQSGVRRAFHCRTDHHQIDLGGWL